MRRTRKGSEAISDYRVLETFVETSLIEVRLHTGKRNQIRIQAALRGHALVGERQYAVGPSKPPALARELRRVAPEPKAKAEGRAPRRFRVRRCTRIVSAFRHPVDDRMLTFEAPLPDDLSALIRRLRT